ncbi:MAG: proton-dependent oligopeptide transporter, family, partial [Mucilaginibacter sp.]|nr:proton-dependent oligopeptide transporter, family [Mucilaginibacter sp.]
MEETIVAAATPKAKIPRSVPFIIGNEFAERFSFYGMRSIIAVFLVHQLFNHENTVIENAHSNSINHTYSTMLYDTNLLGS